MKKFSVIALMCCVVFAFAAAEAKIDDSRIALGGIVPGSRLSDVIAVYGQPTETELSNRWDGLPYVYYGTGNNRVVLKMYSVGLSFKGTDGIETVSVKSNNGFATPDGVKVGTPAAVLLEKYGKPDFVKYTSDGVVEAVYYYGFCLYFRFGTSTTGTVKSIYAGCQGDYAFKKSDPQYRAMALAMNRIEVPHW